MATPVGATGATGATGAAAGAGVAGGSIGADASLTAVQTFGAAAIQVRTQGLTSALAAVGADTWLGADAASLQSTLEGDLIGLQRLQSALAAATTVAAARTDVHDVYVQYRVLALALPTFHMVSAADRMANVVIPRLRDFADRAAAKGASPTATAAIVTALTSATTSLAGLDTTLLAFTPAQWNANHSLLGPSRSALGVAQAQLSSARSDAEGLLAALSKSSGSGGGTGGTGTGS